MTVIKVNEVLHVRFKATNHSNENGCVFRVQWQSFKAATQIRVYTLYCGLYGQCAYDMQGHKADFHSFMN